MPNPQQPITGIAGPRVDRLRTGPGLRASGRFHARGRLLRICAFLALLPVATPGLAQPPADCPGYGPEPYRACAIMRCTRDSGWTTIGGEPAGTSCSTLPGGVGQVGACNGSQSLPQCVPGGVGPKCGGVPKPANTTCGSYVCLTNRWILRPVNVGAMCTLGSGQQGQCNSSGSCTAVPPTSGVNVVTYHYDNLRTGWNQNEIVLTPATVNSSSFGILHQTSLPDGAGVDAQPLVVTAQTITSGAAAGLIDVPGQYAQIVYVATEANNIYAIDATSGKVVLSANLGPPVPTAQGISSTPVIDLATRTMYVVANTLDANHNSVYQIHSLDLGNLTDKVTPPPNTDQVANTATDVASTSIPFKAHLQRQRPALLESNGNVYAAFGSLGDNAGARGWVLGWNVPSLTPLKDNFLTNRLSANPTTTFHGQVNTPSNLFLSSVWMSGFGVAADASGDLYFVTGNSAVDVTDVNPDPTNQDFAGELRQLNFILLSEYRGLPPQYGNVADSVVRLRPDLSGVDDGSNAATGAAGNPTQGIFTPWTQNGRDVEDYDFGSGGAMLLPDQTGAHSHLLAAAGKDGLMYLLDRDQLGGFGPPNVYGLQGGFDNALAEVNIGQCWCGPSYFDAGIPYVVSSGGNTVQLWSVHTSPLVALNLEAKSVPVSGAGPGGQDPGFFTSVSSNGSQGAIIWAFSRPDVNNQFWLYAFNAQPTNGGLPSLFNPIQISGAPGGNSNVVPVVANGNVYLATNGYLTILGLLQPGQSPPTPQPPSGVSASLSSAAGHRVTGKVISIQGPMVRIETREKHIALIDAKAAIAQQQIYSGLHVGGPITAFGDYNSKGILQAVTILRAKNYPAWPSDR